MTITEQPETATGPAINFGDVQAAAERLRGVAHRTPVLTSRTLDAMTGAQVYLKAEPFQRIGAFKFRGAYNAISALEPETRVRGVVTNSSGNHAQAVALSGQIFGIPATIVMPTDAPPAKIAATRGYGAEIVFYDRYKEDRAAIAERVAADLGATMIPPYDHPLVMAGNGTTALELIEEVGDDWAQSYAKGERVRLEQVPRTIADGQQTEAPGVLTWRTVRPLVKGIT